MAFCNTLRFKNKTSTHLLFKRLFACVELSINAKAYHLITELLIISLNNPDVIQCIGNIAYNDRAALQCKKDTRIKGGFMAESTILMVDDEEEIIHLMSIYFNNEGYKLLQASNGLEALKILQSQQIDLIVLDLMMPKMDGVQACMKIRETNPIPIIMLSAKGQDIDKIAGLSIGADDYVTKPFNPLELIARIKSQLRRMNQFNSVAANTNEIHIENIIINIASHTVTVDQQEIRLTPRQFALLRMLAVNRGTVLSMDRIYEEVWNEPFMESKNSVMVHIRKLREKIETNPREPRIIKTVWGIGYKIESDLKARGE